MKSIGLAAIIPVLVCSSAALAIVIRDDVSDSRYRQLGERYRPHLVQLAIKSNSGDPSLSNGMGTLVAPQWVLTAAHAAQWISGAPGGPRAAGPHHVFVNGRGYLVEKIIYPDLEIDTFGGPYTQNDIALIKLRTPVINVEPVCVYRKDDELGKVVVLAGMGRTGTGATGLAGADGSLRAATQRVDGVQEGKNEKVIWFRFDAPTSGSALELEGVSGSGDSGGPAFIERNGEICVAGVSSGQDSGSGPQGLYGVLEYYTRVSKFADWIDQTIKAGS